MAKSKKAREDREDRDEKDDARTPVARDGAYVMMLFVALVALAAGCIFMYLDTDEYSGKAPPKESFAIQKLGSELKADAGGAAVPPKGDGAGGGAVPPGMP